MSTISRDYITNVAYARNLKPVKALPFMEALETAYGESAKKAMKYLNSEPSILKYAAGMKAFQERFFRAMSNDGDLSPDDQKYIADITHRVAIGRLIIN